MLEVGGLRLNSPPLVNFHARVVWASLPSLFRVIVGRCLQFGGALIFGLCALGCGAVLVHNPRAALCIVCPDFVLAKEACPDGDVLVLWVLCFLGHVHRLPKGLIRSAFPAALVGGDRRYEQCRSTRAGSGVDGQEVRNYSPGKLGSRHQAW
jgi:hypothetical protein